MPWPGRIRELRPPMTDHPDAFDLLALAALAALRPSDSARASLQSARESAARQDRWRHRQQPTAADATGQTTATHFEDPEENLHTIRIAEIDKTCIPIRRTA